MLISHCEKINRALSDRIFADVCSRSIAMLCTFDYFLHRNLFSVLTSLSNLLFQFIG